MLYMLQVKFDFTRLWALGKIQGSLGCPAYDFFEKTEISKSPMSKCKVPGASGIC